MYGIFKENQMSFSFKDLFILADSDGNGSISPSNFRNFTKRLGISVTEHKCLEIISNVKSLTGS